MIKQRFTSTFISRSGRSCLSNSSSASALRPLPIPRRSITHLPKSASATTKQINPIRAYVTSSTPTTAASDFAPENAAAGCSYVRGLFFGVNNTHQAFPYPNVLDDEASDTINMLVDPVQRFFETEVDSQLIDRDAAIPDEVMNGLKEMGLFGLQIPTEYGGLGLSNTAYSRVVEEVCMDGSIAVTLLAHQSIGLKGILLNGNEKQKRKYLPRLATGEHIAAFALTEPSAGSDAASVKSRAVLSDDGKHFILNGEKIWISNGGIAEIFTVFAQTPVKDPKTGETVDKVTAFIVERSFGGLTHGKPEDKLGIRGSNTCALHFDNVKIPIENVLGEVGEGFKVAMNILNNGRFGLGAGSGAAIKRGISVAIDHACNRKQFGKSLSEFKLIKEKFAKIAMDGYVCESLAFMTTAMIDRGDKDCYVEAAICKVYGSEASFRSVNEVIQILGGLGFMKDYPAERALRDSRILSIFEGTNEILRMLIALSGVKGAGDRLKGLAKSLKNPITAIPVGTSEIIRRAQRKISSAPKLTGAHSSMSESATFLSERTRDFGAAVEHLLTKHGKNIIWEQIELTRVADITIDLYGMTAVISRASKALESSSVDPSAAEHERKLATAFCKKANKNIQNNLQGIYGSAEETGDDLMEQIADDVFEAQHYIPVHPIEIK
eukprot:Nk52_evm158s226 gene=Nk52_evmTU158s226